MKALRKKTATLQRLKADKPKFGAYVVTQSGTHVPAHRPDLTRKYGQVEYSGDDPYMVAAYEMLSLRKHWRRITSKNAKKRNAGSPHCCSAQWMLRHKATTLDHCIFMPSMIPHRVTRVRYNFKTMAAARAMAIAVHGLPEEGQIVIHKCGKGHLSCINPNHITWGDQLQNAQDRVIHDSNTPDKELTRDQVAEVKSASGMFEVIAWQLRVPVSQVKSIKREARPGAED